MSVNELTKLFTEGIFKGLLNGALIILPYIIGFCAICVIIHIIKHRKK